MTEILLNLAECLRSKTIRVVDLTQTLSPNFPTLALRSDFAQVPSFTLECLSRYDKRGPFWYMNAFSCGEHSGTHFDAPIHWVTGRRHEDGAVDTIPPQKFIAPACVVDASREVAENADWILTVDFLKAWERQHGRICSGAWLLFRTDWSKRISNPASFVNLREDGAHTPGPSAETIDWLIRERDVCGFGVETINTDAGQSHTWSSPLPCHTKMHGANKYGLQCLTNLDQLPPHGALIIAAPLKIERGSGSPLRVLALVA